MASNAAVILIATLDTKGEEALFMRNSIRKVGLPVRVIDVSILGQPLFKADIPREVVASKANVPFPHLTAQRDRAQAVEAMRVGVTKIATELHDRGEVAGVISIGGSGGTTIGTAAMRALPLGVPKVMLSTLAAGDVSDYVGSKDVCMMHSVVDFCGVNPISEVVLRNACGAICGMIQINRATTAHHAQAGEPRQHKALVAASMFGVTTPCINHARAHLKKAGLELVPFHATGSGGRIMESLIAEGFFCGLLDLTTTEWADEVVGGSLSAGTTRLEAAGKAGLPQVVAPGALDMVNFVGVDAFPERFKGRRIHRHNENVVLMRTTAEECYEIGRRVAGKLNAAKGHVTVMFPNKGLSSLDVAGGVFYNPEADQALLEALRKYCRPEVEVRVLELHINDDAFAAVCCQQLLASLSE
jgi:uncharacterized protein (UPF0261 family)